MAGRSLGAPENAVSGVGGVTPATGAERARGRGGFFVVGSLLLHAGVYALAAHQPIPLLSVGEQAISVEIVVGGEIAAGQAAAPSEAEAPLLAPAETPKQPLDETQTEPAIEPEHHSPRQAPEPTIVETTADVAEPAPRQEAVSEEVDARPEPVTPEPLREAKPAAKPDQVVKPEKPHKKPESKPVRTAAAAAPASSGVGRGRSDSLASYQGLIVAHLARNKRYPADARARREEGSATVRFSIDRTGRVTEVAVTRGSGSPALDRETEAMVRRASPFPAPPDGKTQTFSAPVSFRLE